VQIIAVLHILVVMSGSCRDSEEGVVVGAFGSAGFGSAGFGFTGFDLSGGGFLCLWGCRLGWGGSVAKQSFRGLGSADMRYLLASVCCLP